jgi:hypothetical protein
LLFALIDCVSDESQQLNNDGIVALLIDPNLMGCISH